MQKAHDPAAYLFTPKTKQTQPRNLQTTHNAGLIGSAAFSPTADLGLHDLRVEVPMNT